MNFNFFCSFSMNSCAGLFLFYVCAHAHALPLRCRGKDRTAAMGCSYFTYALTRMALPLILRGKDRRAFSPLERRSLRLSEADGAAAEARIAWFCAVKRSKSRPYYKKIEFLSVDCLNLSKIPVCLKR